jgi:hypothetical protein
MDFLSRIYLSYLTIAIAVTWRSTFQVPLGSSDKLSNIYQRMPKIQYFITYSTWCLAQVGFRPVITALPWLRTQRKLIVHARGCLTARCPTCPRLPPLKAPRCRLVGSACLSLLAPRGSVGLFPSAVGCIATDYESEKYQVAHENSYSAGSGHDLELGFRSEVHVFIIGCLADTVGRSSCKEAVQFLLYSFL